MNASEEAPIKRGRGRPSAFDRSRALDMAMKLFWERGYEGTTFDELIAAMGVGPSSFYRWFGSKEELYAAATEHYLSSHGVFFGEALSRGSDTRSAFEALIAASAEAFTTPGLPTGCMVSLAGAHCPPALASVGDAMRSIRALTEQLLLERLRAGVAAGDVSPETDIEELAAFFEALFRGMAVKARDGASRERLLMIGRAAMRVWPSQSANLSSPRARASRGRSRPQASATA